MPKIGNYLILNKVMFVICFENTKINGILLFIIKEKKDER